MGNYGNTLDRWYRRAAIVLWPRARDFIARAAADLPRAIAELDSRVKDGDAPDRARADARELAPLVRAGSTGLLAPLLSVADGIHDPELAHDLLVRLGGDGLAVDQAPALAAITQRYGDAWTRRLIAAWFPANGYRLGHWEWAGGILPGLALALRRADAGNIATCLCRQIWAGLTASINAALTAGPRSRARSMASLVDPVEGVFRAADAELVEEFVASLAARGEGVVDLELPLLGRLGVDAPASLIDDATRRLEARLATPPRPADDWSIVWTGCGCDLCETLQGFLGNPVATELAWPLRTDRRQHIHRRIESDELPVTHRTIRKGSPYTLRLVKQPDLHDHEAAQRRQAAADLARLRRDE